MLKIENGHYRQTGPGGFDVYLFEGREYHQRTARFRIIKFWSFRVGDYAAQGYATKQQAVEAARNFIQAR